MPYLRQKKEITAVLSQFKSTSEDVRNISSELVGENGDGQNGIGIKNMILSIELALQSNPKAAIEYETFMEAYRQVNHQI